MSSGPATDRPVGSPLETIAGDASGLRFEHLPADVVTLAGMSVLDTVGVAVAARDEPVVRIVRDEMADAGGAALWGGGTTSPGAAALVNGVAAHALDYDDYAPGSGLHPSAPLVAALLAAASRMQERGEQVNGRDLVTAYVAGYEVQERLGAVLWPSHYARGFHTTGTAGTVGAAAGVARLLGGGPAQMRAAISLGATDAAGLKAMFGSMGKPYHAGRAAASGLRAARLAIRGMTVGDDPVFGPQGLIAASSGESDLAAARTLFGEPWHVRDVLLKLSPSCFGTHAAITCGLQVRPAVGAAGIARIVLTVPPVLLDVCAIPAPRTGLEGKFSLAYTTATALLDGDVTVASFSDEAVAAAPVAALGGRVELALDDTLVKTATGLRVELDDGRTLTAEHDAAQRLWTDDPEEVRPRAEAKFRALTADVGTASEVLAMLCAHRTRSRTSGRSRRCSPGAADERDICLDFGRGTEKVVNDKLLSVGSAAAPPGDEAPRRGPRHPAGHRYRSARRDRVHPSPPRPAREAGRGVTGPATDTRLPGPDLPPPWHTPARAALLSEARRFSLERLRPVADELDPRRADIPAEVLAEMGALGYFGVMIPAEYGGLGLGVFEYCLVSEELARSWLSAASIIARAQGLGTAVGDEERRGELLARSARGEWIGAAAFSEPDAGSDLAGVATTAVRDGDEFVVSGSKRWCGNAVAADFIVLLCRFAEEEPRGSRSSGLRTLLLEKKPGELPVGVTATPIDKIGYYGMTTYDLVLDEVRVPVSSQVEAFGMPVARGQGFAALEQGLNMARVQTAARAVGLARAAVEDTASYLQQRVQFGRPIGDFQALRFQLAEMAARVDQARAHYRQVATLMDEGVPCETEAAMVKLMSTEMAAEVTAQAIQLHGGNGYTTEHQVERYWRDARLTTIFEGTSQIQQLIISDRMLGKVRA